jgi:hypothetical protein
LQAASAIVMLASMNTFEAFMRSPSDIRDARIALPESFNATRAPLRR